MWEDERREIADFLVLCYHGNYNALYTFAEPFNTLLNNVDMEEYP